MDDIHASLHGVIRNGVEILSGWSFHLAGSRGKRRSWVELCCCRALGSGTQAKPNGSSSLDTTHSNVTAQFFLPTLVLVLEENIHSGWHAKEIILGHLITGHKSMMLSYSLSIQSLGGVGSSLGVHCLTFFPSCQQWKQDESSWMTCSCWIMSVIRSLEVMDCSTP